MNTHASSTPTDQSQQPRSEYPSYFVVQVKTNNEEKYIQLAKPLVQEMGIRFFWPRRSLRIKKKGKWRDSLATIFPGYIFIEAVEIGAGEYKILKGVPGFSRFLKSNQDIRRLPAAEARVLARLMSLGEVVKKTLVSFDENNRIQIVEGPLKGMEGRIVKVDRRKGRAKVKLDLYEEAFLVDFGFQDLRLESQNEEK